MELTNGRRKLITNRIETLNLVELVNFYLENFVPPEKEHTHRAKVSDFNALLDYAAKDCKCSYGELVLADISPALLHGYRENLIRLGRAPATVNRNMATLKHFGKKIKERVPGWFNPFAEIRDLPKEDYEFRGLEQKEAEELARCAYLVGSSRFVRGRSGLLIEIALGCGLRSSELSSLTIGHLSDDLHWFRDVRCKGDKFRNVYIPSDVRESIKTWLPIREYAMCEALAGYTLCTTTQRRRFALLPTLSKANVREPESTQLDAKTIWRTFDDAAKLAEMEHVHPHKARHTFARQVMDSTKDITTVAEALGHSDIKVTARYLRNKPAMLARAIEGSRRKA